MRDKVLLGSDDKSSESVIEKQVSAESPRNVSEEKHSRYLKITCIYEEAEHTQGSFEY